MADLTLIEAIRIVRIDLGRSQSDVAAAAHITREQLNRIERGHGGRFPTSTAAICHALGFTYCDGVMGAARKVRKGR